MKKRIAILGALAVMVSLCAVGCSGKKVDLTKTDGVLDYRQSKTDKKQFVYEIDVHKFIDVKYEGGNGCGTYKIDTTELEKFVLNRTSLVEGSVEYEELKTSIQKCFEVSAVDTKHVNKHIGIKGYLTNGDVIEIEYTGFYIPSDKVLKHSSIVINDETKAKEYTVKGIEPLTEDMIWEGVGYKFEEGWSAYRIEMVVDNGCKAVEYEWDIKDTYKIENGDTFEITATMDDTVISKKTFKVEGKPADEQEN